MLKEVSPTKIEVKLNFKLIILDEVKLDTPKNLGTGTKKKCC